MPKLGDDYTLAQVDLETKATVIDSDGIPVIEVTLHRQAYVDAAAGPIGEQLREAHDEVPEELGGLVRDYVLNVSGYRSAVEREAQSA